MHTVITTTLKALENETKALGVLGLSMLTSVELLIVASMMTTVELVIVVSMLTLAELVIAVSMLTTVEFLIVVSMALFQLYGVQLSGV